MDLRMEIKRVFFPGWDPLLRARQRLVRHFIEGDVSTLDAGCGNGAFSLAAYNLGNKVLGININADQVKRCEEYAEYVGANPARLGFVVHNIYNLPALGTEFDQIVCFEVLEHLERDQDALRLFADRLRRGGVLHLCVPNAECSLNAAEQVSTVEDGRHMRIGYKIDELEQMLRQAGLDPIRRDSAGRGGCILATRIHRWLSNGIWDRVPDPFRSSGHVITLIGLSPLRLLDWMIPASPFAIYVAARKSG